MPLRAPYSAARGDEALLERGDVLGPAPGREPRLDALAALDEVEPLQRIGVLQAGGDVVQLLAERLGARSATSARPVRARAPPGSAARRGPVSGPRRAPPCAPRSSKFAFFGGVITPLWPRFSIECNPSMRTVRIRPFRHAARKGWKALTELRGSRSNPSDPGRHRSLGLTDDEYDMIVGILGRRPTDTELAMYSVMWSEHCSYKSSRVHLARLPTEAPHVLVGPGENAGVIDVGDGIAVAIRIESHNHPSYIEPYQGAATGVGGILRDIFTMGARPIALMDPLLLWPARTTPAAGSSSTASCAASPVMGTRSACRPSAARSTFDSTYRGNPLVNVLLPRRAARSTGSCSRRRPASGNLAVLLGSATGRDGIGGVSVLASAGLRRGRTRPRIGEAPERPDRRPLRGEAPHRGLPRAARRRPRRRASRTSAAPGCRARRARPRRTRAWAWTSTSPRCPAASRG